METIKPKAQSKEEKRGFMEILPSAKEEYPERQGRGQKHGCGNIKLPSEKKGFIHHQKRLESQTNLCL